MEAERFNSRFIEMGVFLEERAIRFERSNHIEPLFRIFFRATSALSGSRFSL